MELKFSNVALIKEGTILLDGLTVIAAENDNGKSTVSKLLFLLLLRRL